MLDSHISPNLCLIFFESGLLDGTDQDLLEEAFSSPQNYQPFIFKRSLVLLSLPIATLGIAFYTYNLWLLIAAALLLPVIYVLDYLIHSVIIRVSNSFILSAVGFDEAFHSTIATIRAREIAFFGLLGNANVGMKPCLQTLREHVLLLLRDTVRRYLVSNENLACSSGMDELLESFFTPEMEKLVLSNEIRSEFLQLSSLKELWQVAFLARSEFVRLFLFILLRSDRLNALRVLYSIFMDMVQLKIQADSLSSVNKFCAHKDVCCQNAKTCDNKSVVHTMSRTEKAEAFLGLAIELLKKTDAEAHVNEILRIIKEAQELLAPSCVQKGYAETQLEERNSGDELVMNNQEADFVVNSSPSRKSCQEAYQIFEAVSDPGSQENCSLFDGNTAYSMDDTAHALVNELKSVLVERRRKQSEKEAAALIEFYGSKTVFEPHTADNAVTVNSSAEQSPKRDSYDYESQRQIKDATFELHSVPMFIEPSLNITKEEPNILMETPTKCLHNSQLQKALLSRLKAPVVSYSDSLSEEDNSGKE